jgi:sulfoxide reductase heme-binding subunit YedZ
MLSNWLKLHFSQVRIFVHGLSCFPAIYLYFAYLSDQLGQNPLETLTHVSGRVSLILLVLTLTVTPLRKVLTTFARSQAAAYGKRLSDWNWLVRLRRPLGMWSFTYGAIHAWVFIEFDLAYEWDVLLLETKEKPFLFLGVLALFLLLPLAITSTTAMIRRLGKYWLILHRMIYLIALVEILHFWLSLKPGVWRAWPEALAIAGLLSYRLLLRLGWIPDWQGSDGREVQERNNKGETCY